MISKLLLQQWGGFACWANVHFWTRLSIGHEFIRRHACATIWSCTGREQEVLCEWFPWFSLLLSSENMVPACYGSICLCDVSHWKKSSEFIWSKLCYHLQDQCHTVTRSNSLTMSLPTYFHGPSGSETGWSRAACVLALLSFMWLVTHALILSCTYMSMSGHQLKSCCLCLVWTTHWWVVCAKSSSCFLRATGTGHRWGALYIVTYWTDGSSLVEKWDFCIAGRDFAVLGQLIPHLCCQKSEHTSHATAKSFLFCIQQSYEFRLCHWLWTLFWWEGQRLSAAWFCAPAQYTLCHILCQESGIGHAHSFTSKVFCGWLCCQGLVECMQCESEKKMFLLPTHTHTHRLMLPSTQWSTCVQQW